METKVEKLILQFDCFNFGVMLHQIDVRYISYSSNHINKNIENITKEVPESHMENVRNVGV
jgi:hypothetical protein